jgi:hypothetical protein
VRRLRIPSVAVALEHQLAALYGDDGVEAALSPAGGARAELRNSSREAV